LTTNLVEVVCAPNEFDVYGRLTQGFNLKTKSRIRLIYWNYEFKDGAYGLE